MQRINQMEPWLGKEEQDAVLEYLKSGGWLTEFKNSRGYFCKKRSRKIGFV